MIPVFDSLIGIIMNKLMDEGIKKIAAILNVESDMEDLQSNVEKIKNMLDDLETKKIEDKSINYWLIRLQKVLDDFASLLDEVAAAKRMDTIFSKMKEYFAKNNIPRKFRHINSTLEKLYGEIPRLQLLAVLPNRSVDREGTVFSAMTLILDGLVSAVMEKLVDAGIKKIVAILKVESEMETLKRNMKKIRLVLGVAESKKIESKAIALWLAELREVLYDADDLLDDFAQLSKSETLRYFLKETIIRKINTNLGNINTNLSTITKTAWIQQLLASQPNADRELGSRITDTWSFELNSEIVSIDDGWSMLCKIVFKEEDKGDMNELEEVGKEIVHRCKGLPSAIKVMGGVLKMTDRTTDAWTRVLSKTTWSMQDLPKDIRTSLLLSYEDLPSRLKRCFIYCSLFPQDFNFHPTKLMYMWIAEGFIHQEERTRMEESAEECYNELVKRNLLQVTLDRDGNPKCKMHELIQSLAIFVSQNQYIYVDPKTFGSSGLLRHRHLRFNVENMNVVSEEIIGKEYVRTLMLSTNTKIEEIPDELLSGLRRLRVLDLEGIIIKRLPYSVGNMRQLRFLSISASKLHMLPDSIENLENLETLMIASVLESRSLPEGICKLRNLRHLLVSGRLQDMPNGLDNLKKLRVLDCFVVNECTSSSTSRRGVWRRKKSEPNMKELKDLSELTDLSIHNLERVGSKEEAEEAAIERKTSLKCLTLSCEPPSRISDEATIRKIEEVFAGIEIPENLTELSIDGFFGKQLPDHIGWSRLHQVKSFKLERCKLLEQLPSLGDMPKLETLHISRCPKLKSLGEGLQHATCLKKMTVIDLSELESIENYSSISELEISRNSSLRSVKNLPSLKKMDINECPALEVVKDVGERSSLSISSDEGMTTQPTWSTNANASEIGHPSTVADSEQIASERDEVKRKRSLQKIGPFLDRIWSKMKMCQSG